MAHPEFTCSVSVRHLPEQSDPKEHLYAFAYTVTIRNTGDITAQLVARHWIVTDANGLSEDVRSLAVVGHQPLLKPGETPAKLRTFLRANGITPRRDRVITMTDKRIDTTARAFFTAGVEFTKDFAGQATVFEGASSSLEVREGAEDLMNKQINPIGLIQAAPGFWGETKFGEKDTTFDEKEDTPAPIYLAACVTRGAASDDRFSADTSRMVVMSNTDFLDPGQQRAENVDFLASSVNWLMNRQALAGIGPRSLGTYKMPLLDAQVSFINRVNLFFLPAFLIVIGAFVWVSRRA